MTKDLKDALYNFANQYGNVTHEFHSILEQLLSSTTYFQTKLKNLKSPKIEYYDYEGEPCEPESKSVYYKYVSLGHKYKGEEIFLSYVRGSTATDDDFSNETWFGCFVGTKKDLIAKVKETALNNEFANSTSSSSNGKITINASVDNYVGDRASGKKVSASSNIDTVNFDELLIKGIDTEKEEYIDTEYAPTTIPKRWEEFHKYIEKHCSNKYGLFDTQTQFSNYLFIIELRVCKLFETNQCKLVLSQDKKHVLCNSGCLSKMFNKPIYFIAEFNPTHKYFTTVLPLMSRSALIDYGFDIENLKYPEKTLPYNDVSELFFNANINDVEFDNENSVNHCLEERIARLPKRYKDASLEERYEIYAKDLNEAFRRQSIDIMYFKPYFHIGTKRIQFIIPVYEDNDTSKPLEFGFVLTNLSGYWRIYTVLDSEQVKNMLKSLSPYSKV